MATIDGTFYILQEHAENPNIPWYCTVMVFDSRDASPEIHQFLREALASKDQVSLLSEMMGPHFEDFKKRVLSQP